MLIASLSLPAAASAADPVIAAAGDIACNSTTVQSDRCHQKATSDLIVNAGLSAVLTLGDAQYQNGGFSDFTNYYDKSWGRVKSITYPSVGNHEYQTSGAAGYFDYFNGVGASTGRAGDRSKGYYSFDIGTWHLISLNSNDACTIVSCSAGSAQETWLKADLAAHPNYCTLAFWHHPSFNSGNGGNLSAMQPELTDLYNADADLILGGHAHHYERFAPQNPSAQLDNARGIRQFIVGTGGAFWTSIGSAKANSQVRQNTTYGVLKLTLHPTSYDWAFVPEAGGSFTDAGSGSCHGTGGPPTDTTKPTAPGNLTATAGAGQVTLNWQASTDNVGVTGYRIFRNGVQVNTVTGTTTSYTDPGLAPGPYSYTVAAADAANNVSNSSNTASATVADTTKPTAPGTLSATAGTGQVSLSWQPSTDNVGVTGYRIVRNGVQINVVSGTTTSYTDPALAPGPYSYTVAAADAANNVSDPSNTASATVADTTKPTAPGTLSATAGTGQVDLSWGASTDNVGVTGYRIVRNGVQINVVSGTTTSYTDPALAPGPYSYTVAAADAANNVSDPSNTASATVADTTKPTAPGTLGATAGTAKVDLSWGASTDNVGVTGYQVFRGTTQIATLNGTTTTYSDTGLAAGPYSYTVRAVDAATNVSDPSNTASATVPDTTKPSAPGTLGATAGTAKVDLSWGASTDNVGVTGYQVFRGTTQIATLNGTTTTYSDTGLAAGPYSYTVRAVDAATNVSDPSNTASATVPDTTKPSAPGTLGATAGTAKVDLSWQGSTDDVGVTGYQVFRGTTQIASLGSAARSYSDTGLAAGPHSYTVRAVDAATNLSDPSNTASATVPDTTKPSAPGNLKATGGTGRVALDWQASSDDVGVTGYRIFRAGSEIGSVGSTTTTYTDQGLSPGTYTYQVKAVDAATNVSDPSNSASGTVPDETKPTAPQGLVANGNGPVQVDLSWQASTDNVAVTGYNVYRGGNLVATTGPETSYSDMVLVPGTYTYEVRALDAAGNLSDASNTATVTLLAPDQEKPTAPGNLVASLNGTAVDLTWEASSDNVGVTGYQIYRDSALLESIDPATSYTDTAVPAGDHAYEVRAVDAATNRSDPSNSASVTVPDTEKPTAPQGLAATAVSPSKVDLTWQASTDDVGVTAYDLYRDGAFLESIAPATAYSDTSVTPGPYSYEIYARDAAGNVSAASNTASVTVESPDTENPSAPGNLSAASHGSFKVDLAWLASSDNRGVTRYDIYRNDSLLASIGPATAYSDTSVVPGLTYVYEVHALDAALNDSGPSNTATVTVDPLDTQKPTAPQNLKAVLNGTSQVDLTWQASTDNVGVAGYNVYREGFLIGSSDTTTSYSDGPRPVGTYHYEVRAVDAAGNESDASNTETITVPDSQKPTAPGNLTASPGTAKADLSWQASTDNVGVTGYQVFRGTTQIATLNGTTTTYSDTGLAAGPHSYTVRAVDAATNVSDPSNTASATVPDTTKPTAPGTLGATAGTAKVDLTWQGSTDDVGVTGYQVFRGTTQIASLGSTARSYSDTGLAAGPHSYTVRAVDAATNVSDPSNTASATVPDTTRPTPPGSLTATVTGAQVDLSWKISTDDVGVTKYRVYRGSIRLVTLTGGETTYRDSGVPVGNYRYTIQAMDAAGNLSYPSNGAMVTIADAQKPTAPQNLSASLNGSSVNLAWQAASDNVGVTGYQLFRGTTQIASLNGTTLSYIDTPPGAGSYQYTARAVDAAGNVSDASNTATATVPDTQKPTAPQNLAATANGTSRIDLGWNASSDDVGVTGYRLFRGTTQIASLNGATTTYSDTGLSPGTYQYTVNAIDAAGNVSDASNAGSATLASPPATLTLSPDADARVLQSSPTTNYGTDTNIGADFSTGTSNIESFLRFTVSGVGSGSVLSAKVRLYSTSDGTADGPAIYTTSPSWSETTVNWNTGPAPTSPATDDKGAIPANSWVEYNVTPFVTGNGTYSFRLATTSTDGVYFSSREAATFKPELVINTGTPDTAKPSAPGNLTANASGPNRIDLSWLTSTDNIGVTGYNVYRGGTLLAGIGSTTSYADSSVAPNTTYSYQVRALDAAANISDPSNSASATTPAAPPAPIVQTIAPEADARVQQSALTTNYGTSYLRVDGATDPLVESFLRFTVTGVAPASVQSAKLRVYAYSGTADGPAVFTTSPSWSETTVNWNTRPTPTSSATDKKGTIATNSWVEYDVTPFVTGNGTYSFRLATTSTDGADFYSRENATLRPELVVTSR